MLPCERLYEVSGYWYICCVRNCSSTVGHGALEVRQTTGVRSVERIWQVILGCLQMLALVELLISGCSSLLCPVKNGWKSDC